MTEESEEYMHKIVLVGDENVGKTSIIIRYTEKRFVESYRPTLGVDFAVKVVELKGNDNKKKSIKLACWDLGGQEQYRTLRRFYLSGARGCIIVFDVTNPTSFEHVVNWHDDVVKICGNVPCFLVGNKIDLKNERRVSRSVGSELASKLGLSFFETSAKTGESVDDLFEIMAKTLYESYML
ncbi:MAG: Rab family GTPase [Candidatus Jordarchaeaceae archaeon]